MPSLPFPSIAMTDTTNTLLDHCSVDYADADEPEEHEEPEDWRSHPSLTPAERNPGLK